MEAAIQNLDFLRKLIEETRREVPIMDLLRLRMIQNTGLGTDSLTTTGSQDT